VWGGFVLSSTRAVQIEYWYDTPPPDHRIKLGALVGRRLVSLERRRVEGLESAIPARDRNGSRMGVSHVDAVDVCREIPLS
jgi:hypothetical protein